MAHTAFNSGASVQFCTASVGDGAGLRLEELIGFQPEEIGDLLDVLQLELVALAVEKARHPRAVFAATGHRERGGGDMVAGEKGLDIEPEIVGGFDVERHDRFGLTSYHGISCHNLRSARLIS